MTIKTKNTYFALEPDKLGFTGLEIVSTRKEICAGVIHSPLPEKLLVAASLGRPGRLIK